MKVLELRSVLEQLRRLYAAGGAKGADKDLASLSKALEGHDKKSVNELVADARRQIDKSPTKSGGRKGNINEDAIETYARRLRDAGTDKDEFYQVFSQLTVSVDVGLAEVDVIARHFTGYKAKYRKRQTALDDIEKVFIERARFENKIKAQG